MSPLFCPCHVICCTRDNRCSDQDIARIDYNNFGIVFYRRLFLMISSPAPVRITLISIYLDFKMSGGVITSSLSLLRMLIQELLGARGDGVRAEQLLHTSRYAIQVKQMSNCA